MTDSTAPDGSSPMPEERDTAGETSHGDEQTQDPTKEGETLPESTTNAAPLSDSTEGGLEGGDPGVEE